MTDSPYVAVSAVLMGIYHISVMSLVGTCGMDVYADEEFCGIIQPDTDTTNRLLSGIVTMHSSGEHLIEVNLPLYAGVEQMMIGIDENASLKRAPGYTHDTPIVMLSCPRADLAGEWGERLAIIQRTYDNAVKAGDKNIYFLNGSDFFAGIGYDYSEDGVHPTDLGFDLMARAIFPTLKKLLSHRSAAGE